MSYRASTQPPRHLPVCGRKGPSRKSKGKSRARSQRASSKQGSYPSSADEEFFSAEESLAPEAALERRKGPGRVIQCEEVWSASRARTGRGKQERPALLSDLAGQDRQKTHVTFRPRRSRHAASQSSSANSSFGELDVFDITNTSTAATSARTSFNDKSSSTSKSPVDEEIPTDVDEYSPTTPKRKVPATDLPLTTDTFKHDQILENFVVSEQQEQTELEQLQIQLADYVPDSDEEHHLFAMQSEFDMDQEVPILCSPRYMQNVFDSDSDSSECETFGIPDSMLAEMTRLNLDVFPRKPIREFSRFPFFVQHEIIRVSLALGISLSECRGVVPALAESHYNGLCEAHSKKHFWNSVENFAHDLAIRSDVKEPTLPIPIADIVWLKIKETDGWPNEIEFSGTANYDPQSPEVDFNVELNPLELRTQMNRFSCRFGSDRFLTLRLPGVSFQELKRLPTHLKHLSKEDLRQQTVDWLTKTRLSLLNRTWRCFYIRTDNKKRKEGGISVTETFLVGYFFAESGIGIGNPTLLLNAQLGFKDDKKLIRQDLSREDLILWHMPLRKQMAKIASVEDYDVRGGMFAKIWSRITLSLSTSRPTVTFKSGQIQLVNDIESKPADQRIKPEVMNDGCCVCSPAVMRMVRDELGLTETPCCVQARVGGAKGIWFVDPDADHYSDDIWIKINKSQLKYDFHDEDVEDCNLMDSDSCDWARMTLFVLSYPKNPSAATLNVQLVPILNNRGVPFSVFRDVLEEHLDQDLEELMQAAIKRKELWYWLNGTGGIGQERCGNGQIFQCPGGFPLSDKEQMTMLLEAGFEPLECDFLIEKLHNIVEQQCESVVDHLHIRVPQSTIVLCIADPTGTLNEGEISLQFSKGFVDDITKVRHECLEGDVLVARNPAHLPSDIQKVRAVSANHPGLRRLKDVVIFSTVGDFPLAGMLSGGDYDGDKVWVCWDARFVNSFTNARYRPCTQLPENQYFRKMPLPPTILNPIPSHPQFGNQFFHRGFTIAMQESYLGAYTNMLETYAYNRKWRMDSKIMKYAMFCGIFVDAMKQGLVPTDLTLKELHESRTRMSERPAYKTPKEGSPGGDPEDWFILDRLVFDVAKKKADEKKIKFDQLKATVKSKTDPHVTALYHREWKRAQSDKKKTGDRSLMDVILVLQRELRELGNFWRESMGRSTYRRGPEMSQVSTQKNGSPLTDFKSRLAEIHARYIAIRPSARHLDNNCRARIWYETADEPFSYWRLLKASTLYFVEGKSKLPWWVAASDICQIKSNELSYSSDSPIPRAIAQDFYLYTKPNPRFSPLKSDTFGN